MEPAGALSRGAGLLARTWETESQILTSDSSTEPGKDLKRWEAGEKLKPRACFQRFIYLEQGKRRELELPFSFPKGSEHSGLDWAASWVYHGASRNPGVGAIVCRCISGRQPGSRPGTCCGMQASHAVA